ncbi:MAG: vWA domain-containing protein [Luteibaculaceae bacterium]
MIINRKIYRSHFLTALLWVLFLSLPTALHAQNKKTGEKPLTRILFIFDASNSMNVQWGEDTRLSLAKRLLSEAVNELKGKEDLEIALRVYGHRSNINTGPQDCEDTQLVVPFKKNNHEEIIGSVRKLRAIGTTPIARSLEKSAADFPPCNNCRNVIILITDGIEACDGDPCAIAKALRSKNIILKPFVIGIGIETEYLNAFDCIGSYFDAQNAGMFKQILDIVITQALNPTTVQFNLLSTAKKPIETDILLTLVDMQTGKEVDSFIHTLNNLGLPDTLTLESQVMYRVVAHTTPVVIKDSVVIEPGIHNIIPLNTPQGSLRLNFQDFSDEKISVAIKQHGQKEIVTVQELNSTRKLLTGYYDLEVLCKPIMRIDKVQINQSHTTRVEIPSPGAVTLNCTSQGYGAVVALLPNGTEEKVLDIFPEQTQYNIKLMPGEYKVVFRPKSTRQTIYSTSKTFTIKSLSTTTIKLPL